VKSGQTPVLSVGSPAPGTDLQWWVDNSTDGSANASSFGNGGDYITPADFDGDGITDIATWRPISLGQPSGNAAFFVFNSSDSTVDTIDFGQIGDNPQIVGDYDGDGKDDPAVFRCDNVMVATGGGPGGACTFYYQGSAGSGITYVPWGNNGGGPLRPYPGDFDGDGKFDFAVHRPVPGVAGVTGVATPGQFAVLRSSDGADEYINWGTLNDALAPGDYDGDGRSDFMIARDNGNIQWWLFEADGGTSVTTWGSTQVASTEEFLAPGDYDGDGKTDITVYRRNNEIDDSTFYVLRSSDGLLQAFEWGNQADIPANGWNVQYPNLPNN
jgi:hypothetical protein